MTKEFLFIISTLLLFHNIYAKENGDVYPGADERTPSLSQYFSWINNTNEGSTPDPDSGSFINLILIRVK